MSTEAADLESQSREYDLLDSISPGAWWKLPLDIMRDCGPAVQTFGGILKVTNSETFCATSEIAKQAKLPIATTRKHLVKLAERGWIENAGRLPTRAGYARRTCTLKLTKKGKAAVGEYGVLPWWTMSKIRNKTFYPMPWAARAVLAVVISRLMGLKSQCEEQDPYYDDPWGAIAHIAGTDHFSWSLERLEYLTGLSRHSVIQGKRLLANCHIVDWTRNERDDGGHARDALEPDPCFIVRETPSRPGYVFLDFTTREYPS